VQDCGGYKKIHQEWLSLFTNAENSGLMGDRDRRFGGQAVKPQNDAGTKPLSRLAGRRLVLFLRKCR